MTAQNRVDLDAERRKYLLSLNATANDLRELALVLSMANIGRYTIDTLHREVDFLGRLSAAIAKAAEDNPPPPIP